MRHLRLKLVGHLHYRPSLGGGGGGGGLLLV